jgi:hypothetical protein
VVTSSSCEALVTLGALLLDGIIVVAGESPSCGAWPEVCEGLIMPMKKEKRSS